MTSKKILVVIGATGQQGGSVISHVSAHPTLSQQYKIRGVTRDASRAKLPPEVEVVQANLDDVDSLKKAFEGGHTVFGVTNYWERCDKEYEKQQGINIVDAAKVSGIQHLIWSASTNCEKVSGGRVKDCEYFDNKAQVMEYIEHVKGDMIATYPVPGVFMQNFKREVVLAQSGSLIWPKPWDQHKTRIPLIDASDSGMYVAGILLQDSKLLNGKRILGTAEELSPQEMLDIFNSEAGKKVKFQQVSHEEFSKNFDKRFAAALTANMVWMRDYGFFGPGSEESQRESDRVLLDFKPKKWGDFVRRNGPWKWAGHEEDMDFGNHK